MSDLIIGTDWDVINFELTSDFQQVTYSRAIRGFRIQARGESDVYHKRRSSDSNYTTIKAGSNHPYEIVLLSATASLGYFSCASGSETLEIIVFF